jgi:hypothetical protein
MHWKLVVHCASEQLREVWVTACLRKPQILSARARTSAAAASVNGWLKLRKFSSGFITDEVVGFGATRQQQGGDRKVMARDWSPNSWPRVSPFVPLETISCRRALPSNSGRASTMPARWRSAASMPNGGTLYVGSMRAGKVHAVRFDAAYRAGP